MGTIRSPEQPAQQRRHSLDEPRPVERFDRRGRRDRVGSSEQPASVRLGGHDGQTDQRLIAEVAARACARSTGGVGVACERHGVERGGLHPQVRIGKLAKLASPDGDKSYTYNQLGRLETLTRGVGDESFQAGLAYDAFGCVSTIAYPAGEAAFAVTQEYDSYGHRIAVRDSATKLASWKLTGVDDAGRFQQEAFGNDVVTTQGRLVRDLAVLPVAT